MIRAHKNRINSFSYSVSILIDINRTYKLYERIKNIIKIFKFSIFLKLKFIFIFNKKYLKFIRIIFDIL